MVFFSKFNNMRDSTLICVRVKILSTSYGQGKASIATKLLLYIASSKGSLRWSLVEMQWSVAIPMHIRGQKVTCTTRYPLTSPIPRSRWWLHDKLATSCALGA